MRIALDPRARRLLRRVPRTNVYTLLELALLSLLAIQCARLVWTIVTPVGPVGEWSAEAGRAAPAGLLAGFDPFFRLSPGGGPVQVTALNLKLYGVRQDQASGRGSAIVATPDGQQRSFAVGEEVVPGVTLVEVGFDSVALSRDGTTERLFMDQSAGAAAVPPAGPAAPSVQPAPPIVQAPAPAAGPGLAAGVRLQPRLNGSRVTGVLLFPQGDGEAFRAAGLAPGDVLLSVNGARISSPDQLRTLAEQLGAAGTTVQVERGGRVIGLRLGSGR